VPGVKDHIKKREDHTKPKTKERRLLSNSLLGSKRVIGKVIKVSKWQTETKVEKA